jgi:hypothetical protein
MDLPASQASAGCYELVQEVAPELWEAFGARLRPVAEGDGDPVERIRELMRLEQEIWDAFVAADTDSRRRALGRAWPCCVEDLIGATATAAIPEIAGAAEPAERRRERLEALRAVVKDERPPSFGTAAIGFEIQAALNAL